MKVSEHLKKLHTAMAGDHVALAKAHRAALGKAQAMESDGDGLTDFHQTAMDVHTAAAEYHVQCCKDLSATGKAAGMDSDELEPLPEGLSRVTPTPPHIKMVPRAGQQEIPSRPNVPQEFEKLVVVDEDEVA